MNLMKRPLVAYRALSGEPLLLYIMMLLIEAPWTRLCFQGLLPAPFFHVWSLAWPVWVVTSAQLHDGTNFEDKAPKPSSKRRTSEACKRLRKPCSTCRLNCKGIPPSTSMYDSSQKGCSPRMWKYIGRGAGQPENMASCHHKLSLHLDTASFG